MKKVLFWIMAVLIVLLLALCLISELTDFSVDAVLAAGALLLIGILVFYSFRYAGVRCPNCGCRVNSKYGRQKAFEGRFPCPKCGAMIEQ